MKKIVEIDNKLYYGKVFSEQDLVILFKKPKGTNNTKWELFFKDLLDIIKDRGYYLFSSDIVNHAKWNNDEIKTIGEYLYVHNGKSVIVSEGLNCICSLNYDELYEGNKLIAKVQTANKINYRNWVFAMLGVLCILVILFCIFDSDINPKEPIPINPQPAIVEKTNEQDYPEDILALENDQDDMMEDDNILNDNFNDEHNVHVNNGKTSDFSEERADNREIIHKKSGHVVKTNEIYNIKKHNEDVYQKNIMEKKFNSLVSEADEFYRSFFDGDESAARHAIEKYDEALKIKSNSMVSKRRDILKQEIKKNE